MTASEIIEEIRRLDPKEQLGMIRFAYQLDIERKLGGDELSTLAKRMVDTSDDLEAARIREMIMRGFYGNAGMPKIRRRNGAVGNRDMAGTAAK